MKLKDHMLSPRGLSVGAVALGFAFAISSSGYADDIFKAKLYCGFSADVQILRD